MNIVRIGQIGLDVPIQLSDIRYQYYFVLKMNPFTIFRKENTFCDPVNF